MSLPRKRGRKVEPGDIVAALDVGSTKVCSLIAVIESDLSPRIIGTGHRVSRGVSAGAVVDMEETESAVRAAVDQAERIAGSPLKAVYVNCASGNPKSRIVEMEVDIGGHAVDQNDVDRVLSAAAAEIKADEARIIHAYPACFAIDGNLGMRDPIGMFGDRLAVAMHVVSAQTGPLRNLEICVERAHLDVAHLVLSPYAAGLAALVPDEADLGAACVDLGGGTTTVSVFAKGALVYADVLPLGGAHITEDIARNFLAPMHQAERLKILHGAANFDRFEDREIIDVPQVGENELNGDGRIQISRADLVGVIRPRLDALFGAVRRSLDKSGFNGVTGRRVVLTGGGSQLAGLRDYAHSMLDRQIRFGRPSSMAGLADSASGPAFSVCVGMLKYALEAPLEYGDNRVSTMSMPMPHGKIARMGHWLRENF